MDFHTNDVGYVPMTAGHYVQNTGNTDLVFLEMFKANQFMPEQLAPALTTRNGDLGPEP
jgi:oxalate decarboxylase